MPEREFELFLSLLGKLMRMDPSQATAIADEFRDHLENRFAELQGAGVSRDDAIKQALDEFGDAAGLAQQFTSLARRRKRRLLMRCTFAAGALGLLVFLGITMFNPGPQPNGPNVVAQDDPPATPIQPANPKPPATAKWQGKRGPTVFYLEETLPTPILAQPTELEFIDTPLEDAAAFIADHHKLNVILDKQALEDEGYSVDTPIDVTAKEIPLHHALNWMLEPLGMTWIYRDGLLVITTVTRADETLVTKSYETRGLLMMTGDPYSRDQLMQMLQSASGALWEDIDGMGGTMTPVGPALVIRQTAAAHREIQRLMDGLNKVRAVSSVVLAPQSHAGFAPILAEETAVDFIDTPLADAANFLADHHKVVIRIDENALFDEGVAADEPVNLRLSRLPFKAVLRLILEPLGLTCVTQDSSLLITTVSVADERLMNVLYNVADLADTPERQSELTVAIQDGTSGLWEDVDGAGGALIQVGPGVLVIRATQKVHEEIAELLTAQREISAAGKDFPAKPEAAPTFETKSYRFDAETAEGLLKALPKLVEPDSWETSGKHWPAGEERGSIFLVGDGREFVEYPEKPRKKPKGKDDKVDAENPETGPEYLVVPKSTLLIRQARDVHRKIDAFLAKNGLSAYSRSNGGVFSGGMNGAGRTGTGFFSVPTTR